MTSVNASTAGSIRMVSAKCRPAGRKERIRLSAQYPSARPAAPPSELSSRLSVSNWRVMRPRPAPSAVRSAISLRRAMPRAI